MERSFTAGQIDRVDRIVELVRSAKKDVLLKEDKVDGHFVTVYERLNPRDREAQVRAFCSNHSGTIKLVSPPPKVEVPMPLSPEQYASARSTGC
jgi:hypothetical protein